MRQQATVTRCPARPGNSSRRAADKGAPRQPVPSVLTTILSRAQRATRCCQCRTLPWSPPPGRAGPKQKPNTTSVAGTESGKSAHPPHATAEHRGRAVRRPVPRCAGHRAGPAARAVGDPRPRQRAAYRQFRCISDGQRYDQRWLQVRRVGAVIKSSSRRWLHSSPGYPGSPAVGRAVCLYIASLGVNVRICRRQGRALLTRHDGTSAMLPGPSPRPRMKDGLVCAAEVIWQAADKHFRERTTMD